MGPALLLFVGLLALYVALTGKAAAVIEAMLH